MPRNAWIFLTIGTAVGLILVLYTVTYSVRFTEAAVTTTFGRATEASIRREPGLGFKAPYPFQSVTKYDTRMRFVEVRSETQQTADSLPIIVQAFCTWRVQDPLKFFQSFSSAGNRAEDHFRKAEDDIIRSSLRSAMSETSRFRMDELFDATPGASKLPELEERIKARLSGATQGGALLSDQGIEVIGVGVSRVLLPESVTRSVFDRMRASRDGVVKTLESAGDSEAEKILTDAETDAQKIRDFADNLARRIMARGDQEAAVYLAELNTHPELAVFLANVELWTQYMGPKATLVFSESTPGFGVLSPAIGAAAQPDVLLGGARRMVQMYREGLAPLPGLARQGPAANPQGPAANPENPAGNADPEGDR